MFHLPFLSRLRKLFGNRRRVPRFRLQQTERLVASVSLFSRDYPVERTASPAPMLTGYARDLSETGLSLVLPTNKIPGGGIIAEGSMLLVVLAMPGRPVSMRVTVLYSRLVDEKAPKAGYIIGLRIVDISDSNRDPLSEYLRSLR